ncbi:MAG: sigma-54 dependent transcriptional regulator [Bacillota bacterium]|nr:sigma-54 dependent transcriptional regulator [Bacillota bacterium]MDW7677288.1 sigma-54 dependent transcriptional regulator [Bacillota bacterium]
MKSVLLTTRNKAFARSLEIAEKAAKSHVNLLLVGESGVGKEVFARFIHTHSFRVNGPFVPVNCYSFSDGLLESELFGHEKGAFTGAVGSRMGRFEAADGGTLFLDEVGEISRDTQVKLLRVLESKSIERIGSNQPITLDFRLVSATNTDLEECVALGGLREDFFYRISTIVIRIPPLRERKEDLESLISFFVRMAEEEHGIAISGMDDEVAHFLMAYDYPGNVRELKSIIERMVVLSDKGRLVKDGLPICTNYRLHGKIDHNKEATMIKPLREKRREFEETYIRRVLEHCGGNITEAAKKLQISRRQLFNKLAEYEADNEQPSDLTES